MIWILLFIPLTLNAQNLMRKEWNNFYGINTNVDPAVLFNVEATSAAGVDLKYRTLRTSLGNKVFGGWLTSGAINWGLWPYRDTAGSEWIVGLIGSTQQRMTTGGTASHLTYGTSRGTATITNGSTAVTLDSNLSLTATQISAGDFIRCNSGVDGDYQSVSTTDSSSGLTLTANYTGTTCTGASFLVRKILTITSGSTYPSGAQLGGSFIMSEGGTSSEVPVVWDGTNQWYNSSIPNARQYAAHKNRMFSCGDVANPSNISWSPTGWTSTTTWNAGATEPIYPNDGFGEIINCLEWGDDLIVFKRYGAAYKIIGNFSTTIGVPDQTMTLKSSEVIGEIAIRGIAVHNGKIFIVSKNGLFVSDGFRIMRYSKNINSYIRNANINNSQFGPTNTNQIFLKSYNGTLYLAINNILLTLDENDNWTVQDSLPVSFSGNFVQISSSLYTSHTTNNPLNILELESGYNLQGGVTLATSSLFYVSNDEDFGFPEIDKEFVDAHILYRIQNSTNTVNRFLFDYSINEGLPISSNTTAQFFSTTTIRSTGTVVGSIDYREVTIGRKGKDIKWRIREAGDALGTEIFKVIITAKPLAYR